MKISKLFHWLYATLMFLPILMFLPACLYFAFNEHATNETTTEINYKYQSNEVNTLDDLVQGNVYEFNVYDYGIADILSTNDFLSLQLLSDLSFGSDAVYDELLVTNLAPYCYINISYDGYLYVFQSETQLQGFDYLISIDLSNTTFQSNCIVRLIDFDFNSYQYFAFSDYNVIESVTTNVEQTIPQQINNAWNSVWNLPVFSWTQNSFISAPFTYITGLFGVQADSTLNYVFTYFCSISICWLVFDLLMYVPNLAHRWLDKGAIE